MVVVAELQRANLVEDRIPPGVLVAGAAQGRDDVVVVDVRSTYEHAIGHFEGAAPLLPSAPLCTGALKMAAQVLIWWGNQ